MNGNPAVERRRFAAALQEDALGAGKLLPDAHEVLALEREVEVTREAVREAVVGGAVAFEASARRGEVDRHAPARAGRRRHRRWPALRDGWPPRASARTRLKRIIAAATGQRS